MSTRRTFFSGIGSLLSACVGVLFARKAQASPALPSHDPDVAELATPSLDAEFQEAERFYDGDQWPPEILIARRAQGRPCIVINYLPAIVRERMAASPTSTFDDWKRLIVETVRTNRDSQRMVNYMVSAQAEAIQYTGPAPWVMDAKAFSHT